MLGFVLRKRNRLQVWGLVAKCKEMYMNEVKNKTDVTDKNLFGHFAKI